VKRIDYAVGASGTSILFDATTGSFLGAKYDDDAPGECPGTSEKIGYSLATGMYEVPSSCQLVSKSDPCGHADGGADSATDAAADATPD
jgi:hypothetical protein